MWSVTIQKPRISRNPKTGEKVHTNKKIKIPGDKSCSIRAMLLASQCIGVSKVKNLLESEDVLNSLNAIKKLGIDYKRRKNILEIKGLGLNGYSPKKNTIINAGNSGTLARWLIGIFAKIKNQIKLELLNYKRSIPFNLGLEKELNPFLNQDSELFKTIKNNNGFSNYELFKFLRDKKDSF